MIIQRWENDGCILLGILFKLKLKVSKKIILFWRLYRCVLYYKSYYELYYKSYYKSYYTQHNDESWWIQRWENQRWENDGWLFIRYILIIFTQSLKKINFIFKNILWWLICLPVIQRWENQLFHHRWANVPFHYTLYTVHYTQYNDESW
jgi:hypothetical protein